MKVKAKKITKKTLPDGGCYVMSKNMDFPKTITYLDALEEACWELFKSYAELAGVIFDEDGDTNFYIAKEIQEKIISLVEENLKVGFPIIGTNENGTFCKIPEKRLVDAEWSAKIKVDCKKPDKNLMETIYQGVSKGFFGGCDEGVEWEIDISINDNEEKELFQCPDFWNYLANKLKKNIFFGRFNKEVNINHYIVDGKKYSAAEIFEKGCESNNIKSPCFMASLCDVMGADCIV